MENLSLLTRAELHERACDAIAAEGRKPSVGTVRTWTLANAGIKRGSDGDAQADINAWFSRLLALKRQKPVADFPPFLTELFHRLWSSALEAAQASLTEERRGLEIEKTRVQGLVTDAEAKSAHYAEELARANALIALMQEQMAGREKLTAHLDAQLAEQRATIKNNDERINVMTADIARLHAEHRARIDVLAANEKRAEERVADQERRAMLEIDEARAAKRELTEQLRQTKESAVQQLESYRIRIAAAETELAKSRGRSDRLGEEITLSAGRIRQLEEELLRERESAAVLALAQSKKDVLGRRVTNPRLRAAVPVRRRKL